MFVCSCSRSHFSPSHIAVNSPVLLLPFSAPRNLLSWCFVITGPNSPVTSAVFSVSSFQGFPQGQGGFPGQIRIQHVEMARV